MQEGRPGKDDGLRKRGADGKSDSSATAAAGTVSAARERLHGSGSGSGGGVEDKDSASGMNLQIWQLALLAIVFFILGRMFS